MKYSLRMAIYISMAIFVMIAAGIFVVIEVSERLL